MRQHPLFPGRGLGRAKPALLCLLLPPSNLLLSCLRVIQTYMIDMENLLNLLDKSAIVKDREDAKQLVVTGGEVVYDNVTFG